MSDITNAAPEVKKEIHIHNPKNKIKESVGYKTFTVCNTILMAIISIVTPVPVHNRHEVIADALNSGLGKISH